jgi:hypothetical protein
MLATESHPPSLTSEKKTGRGKLAAQVVFPVLESPYTKKVLHGITSAGWSRLISRTFSFLGWVVDDSPGTFGTERPLARDTGDLTVADRTSPKLSAWSHRYSVLGVKRIVHAPLVATRHELLVK